ncbi:MAG: efflux RND transporter periplasmic adaptor subunit [Gammaproteobacteria bacterium]|nr:efflux RND transporter periplasmic adaptor subunit [Gammaproteobacteria bacterium]
MRSPVAALFLALPLGVLAQAPELLELSPQQTQAFGIETVAVQPVEHALGQDYPAQVTVPNAQLRVVSTPLDGVVEALLVAEGETVARDQPLARIRSSELLDLQTAYLETRSRRLLAAETLERERQLHSEGIIARRRLLESEARHREQRNAEKRDEQALHLAGMTAEAIRELARNQRLDATLEVRAPLDGVVLEQLATAGQRLMAADPLYRIGHLSPLWVEIHVPLEDLGDVAPGSRVELPAEGIDARIITVGRMVHGTDQGVLVRAEVTRGSERLRPGQFTTARLAREVGGNTLRIPAGAVVRHGGATYVFARHAGGFLPVAATLVMQEGGDALIRAALEPGAAVVSRGTAALKAAWTGDGE